MTMDLDRVDLLHHNLRILVTKGKLVSGSYLIFFLCIFGTSVPPYRNK